MNQRKDVVHIIPETISKPFAQGDVLLIPLAHRLDEQDLGEKVTDVEKNRIYLAYGEVTGHAHVLSLVEEVDALPEKKMEAALYEVKQEVVEKLGVVNRYLPGTRVLRTLERTLLRHGNPKNLFGDFDHHSFNLPAKDYLIVPQHEGDEISEMRRVAD